MLRCLVSGTTPGRQDASVGLSATGTGMRRRNQLCARLCRSSAGERRTTHPNGQLVTSLQNTEQLIRMVSWSPRSRTQNNSSEWSDGHPAPEHRTTHPNGQLVTSLQNAGQLIRMVSWSPRSRTQNISSEWSDGHLAPEHRTTHPNGQLVTSLQNTEQLIRMVSWSPRSRTQNNSSEWSVGHPAPEHRTTHLFVAVLRNVQLRWLKKIYKLCLLFS